MANSGQKKKNRSQSRQNRMIKPETARRKEPTMMTRAHSPEMEKKASQHQTKDRNRGLRELRGSIRALEGDGNERTFELKNHIQDGSDRRSSTIQKAASI